MSMSLWEVFLSSFKRDDEGDESEEGDERFVPSPLDLSIRYAHGGPDNEIEHELHQINEQAREFEENHRGK